MEVTKTEIEGVLILEPKVFGDNRGYFFESFNAREFAEKTVLMSTSFKTTKVKVVMAYCEAYTSNYPLIPKVN